MSECWDEGGLRAYFDRELPSEDLSRIAAHIGACAECHARYNELAARAVRVSSMMSALGVAAQIAPMPAPSRRGWLQPAAAAALALAATAALAFVLIPKRAPQPRPSAAPNVERGKSPSLRPIQAEVETQPAPAKAAHAKSQHRAKAAETDYYLALDDEPIDIGVVMRVALDSGAAVQADVIFDAEGRPRAIRPVKQSSK